MTKFFDLKNQRLEKKENYATGTSEFGLTSDVSGLKGQWLPVMMGGH